MAAPGMRANVQITQKLSTGLRMNQQMQQAIGLLQLSTIELNQAILEEVEKNPLLEIEERENSNEISLESMAEKENSRENNDDIYNNDGAYNDVDGSDSRSMISETGDITSQSDSQIMGESKTKDSQSDDSASTEYNMDSYSAGEGSRGRGLGDIDDSVYEGETTETLYDHLMFQLDMSPLSGSDRMIAEMIIDSVNESGYLTETVEDIVDSLKDKIEDLTEEDVIAVLKLVQHYDPLGIASRSVGECLTIQLNELEKSKARDVAVEMIEKHMDLLSKRDFRSLKQKLSIKDEDLKEAMILIQSLNPRPGNIKLSKKSEYVVPDVVTYKDKDNEYVVKLNNSLLPALKISETYRIMANSARTKEEKTYFKDNERDANWFINSIRQRNETLLAVSQIIVKEQSEFLDKGNAFMKPMILKDVAEQVDRDESTISRITTQKFIHTPRGTFELKYFFSSKVSTADGDSASSTAMKALIKELVDNEDKLKPLSDEAMSDVLAQKGFNVARRTVAKYRDELGIPPKSKRKSLI